MKPEIFLLVGAKSVMVIDAIKAREYETSKYRFICWSQSTEVLVFAIVPKPLSISASRHASITHAALVAAQDAGFRAGQLRSAQKPPKAPKKRLSASQRRLL